MKHQKKKRVGACSLICNVSGVGGCVGILGWDQDKLTKESSRRSQLAQPRKEGGQCKFNGSGATDLVQTISNTSFTRPTTLGRRHHSPSYSILCASLWGTTSKCHFSLGLPNGSPKTRTLIFPKLWTLISLSNQAFFENSRKIHNIPQKDLSNGV